MGMFILGWLILLLATVFIVFKIDDIIYGLGSVMLLIMGTLLMVMGAIENYENDTMKKHNINPAIIEYIVDVRNQNDETDITTTEAIMIYIECKRNGFSEEETILFLLPNITKEEAKSIIKTHNLLGKEN